MRVNSGPQSVSSGRCLLLVWAQRRRRPRVDEKKEQRREECRRQCTMEQCSNGTVSSSLPLGFGCCRLCSAVAAAAAAFCLLY